MSYDDYGDVLSTVEHGRGRGLDRLRLDRLVAAWRNKAMQLRSSGMQDNAMARNEKVHRRKRTDEHVLSPKQMGVMFKLYVSVSMCTNVWHVWQFVQ